MYIYKIKKNGYAIGQARGIHKAIGRIKSEAGPSAVWFSVPGEDGPSCKTETDEYKIERMLN
jgi:hypothetical protein